MQQDRHLGRPPACEQELAHELSKLDVSLSAGPGKSAQPGSLQRLGSAATVHTLPLPVPEAPRCAGLLLLAECTLDSCTAGL